MNDEMILNRVFVVDAKITVFVQMFVSRVRMNSVLEKRLCSVQKLLSLHFQKVLAVVPTAK